MSTRRPRRAIRAIVVTQTLGTKKRPLVTVAPQSIHDGTSQAWLEHSGATQLANLLGWLANSQVACSALAVLDLARGSQAKALLG